MVVLVGCWSDFYYSLVSLDLQTNTFTWTYTWVHWVKVDMEWGHCIDSFIVLSWESNSVSKFPKFELHNKLICPITPFTKL
jgi:hypothetical protein